MSLVNDIERLCLSYLGEDGVTPDNFDGTGTVRRLINDAITELALTERMEERTVLVPLRQDTRVYLMGFDCLPYVVREVRYQDENRRLTQVSLKDLERDNSFWMLQSGSPYQYVVLDFTKILIFPLPASDEGTLSIRAEVFPCFYSESDSKISLREEYISGIASYVQSHILLMEPHKLQQAIEKYQEFTKLVGIQDRVGFLLSSLKKRWKE